MKIISIRNNAQILTLYEKIKTEDHHPNSDRKSILDRALDAVIEERPDLQQINAINMDWVYDEEHNNFPDFFQVKADETKIEIVSEMIKNSFAGLKVVRMPFLVKLALMYYYFEKVKNRYGATVQASQPAVNTAKIRKTIAEINSALAGMKGQSMDNFWEKIHILKEASVRDIIFYDLKDEWKNFIPYAKQELSEHTELHNDRELNFNEKTVTPWQKMCCYKIAPDTFDCDVSLRTVIIYALAFPYTLNDNRYIKFQAGKTEKFCIGNKNGNKNFEYHGDTMNSYATTIQEFLRKNNKKSDIYDYKKGKKYLKYSSWSACVLDNYTYFDSILPPEAKLFISLTHTIGNFIPIPPSFQNRGSAKGLIRDYWDLTLLAIYNYYFPNRKNKKRELNLENISLNSTAISQWLDEFHNWDTFVEQNYMQDFVNEGDRENKYGEPKELWKGHFDNSTPVLPVKEGEQFEQFFTNASAWITARGTRIAIELKNKLNESSVDELAKKLAENGGE